MLWMCVSTVFGLRKSFSQMPWFERPSRHQLEHLALALRSARRSGSSGRAVRPSELRDDLRVDRGAAAGDAAHRLEEIVDLEDRSLSR